MSRSRSDHTVTLSVFLLALVVFFALQLPSIALAEDFQENVGFAPNHMFEIGQFGEAVDVTNGNMTISVPVGPEFTLNDLSYGVVLTYNSKLWNYANADSPGGRKPFLKQTGDQQFGVGWSFHAGRVFLDDPNIPYYDAGHATFPDHPKPRRIQYERADGSRTVLYAENYDNPLTGFYYSQDATYLRAKPYVVHEGNNPSSELMLVWKLWEPDGTTRIFGYQVGTGRLMVRHDDWVTLLNPPQEGGFLTPPTHQETTYSYDLVPHDGEYGWYTSRLESVHKIDSTTDQCDGQAATAPKLLELSGEEELVPCSYVEYFYDQIAGADPTGTHSLPTRRIGGYGNLNFMQDSLGRQVEIRSGSITYEALGQPVTYQLEYEADLLFEPHWRFKTERTLADVCVWKDPNDPDNLGVEGNFLSRITYPHGYTMEFEYLDPDCTGVMSARVLPTGARSEYEYEVYSYEYDNTLGHGLVRRRSLVDGQDPAVWQYARDPRQVRLLGLTAGPSEPDDPGNSIRPDEFGQPEMVPVDPEGGVSGTTGGNTTEFSNPPRVYETDPDGNMTVYYLYYKCDSAAITFCGEFSDALVGRTWKMLRTKGSSNEFVSKEVYEFETDGFFDQPYDKRPEDPDGTDFLANLRKKATQTFVYDNAGSTLSRWTIQSNYQDYGKYGTITEYEPESTSQVYRTTEKTYRFEPDKWVLGVDDSTIVREGSNGTVVSHSDVTLWDAGGLPKQIRAYPDPAVTSVYVETVNDYNDKGILTRTEVTNVGGPATGLSHVTHLFPDDAGRLLYKQFGTLSWYAFERELDATTDLVTKTKTPAGVETTYSYDQLGRLTLIHPVAGGEYDTTISYPSLAETVVKRGGTTNYTETAYHYDQAGRLVRQEKRGSDDLADIQETRYDSAGRKVFESEWVDAGTSQPWPGTTFEYWVPLAGPAGPIEPGAAASTYVADPQGRLTRVTSPDGAITETSYGLLTKSVTVKDLNRLPGSSANPSAPTEATSVFTSDPFGRLIHVDAPFGEDASYTYDVLDNLVQVEMGSQVRTFVYDGMGRLESSNNPENGLVTFDAYEPTGQVYAKTDAANVGTIMTHDQAGRISLEMRTNTGQVLKAYEYDIPQGGANDRALGRLVKVQSYVEDDLEDPNVPYRELSVRREFRYEGLNGRLSDERLVLGDGTDTLITKYYHDALGQLSQIEYPDPSWVVHSPTHVSYFYSNGFLSTVGDGISMNRFIREVSYNPAGGKQLVKYGNDTESETFSDLRNRPESIVVRVPDPTAALLGLPGGGDGRQLARTPGQPAWVHRWIHERPLATPVDNARFPEPLPADLIAQIIPDPGGGGGGGGTVTLMDEWDSGLYQYDGAGNIIAIGTDTFTYDELSRLTGAVLHDLPGNPVGAMTMGYAYDGYGNMTLRTKSVPGSTHSWTFATDGGNHLTTLNVNYGTSPPSPENRSFTFDAVGNLVSDYNQGHPGPRQYSWDTQGRLTEVTEAGEVLGRYAYDDQGYRVWKVEDGIETFYARDTEGRVLSEFRRREGEAGLPVWDKDYVYALGGAIAVVKNQDPAPPTAFSVEWRPDGQPALMDIHLEWANSEEGDIAGYWVYRNDLNDPGTGFQLLLDGGSYTVVHDPNLTGPVIYDDDGHAQNSTFEYYVVTVDTAGHVSNESRHLVADWADETGHETIIWEDPAITAGDQQLTLHWTIDPARATRIVGYRVHRDAGSGYVALTPLEQLIEQPGLLDPGLGTGGAGLSNGTTYTYKVTAVNTRGRETPLTEADDESGTPVDLVPPSPPATLSGQPGPYEGAVLLRWSPSYAPDLRETDPYQVYQDGAPITVRPALLPGPEAFAINFTAESGDGIAGWTKATPATLWDGTLGWLDISGLTGEDSNSGLAEEWVDSSVRWAPGNGSAKTFRIQATGDAIYLVELGIGHPTAGSWYSLAVNGMAYWMGWNLDAADWRHLERAIQASSEGYLDILIGDGVYINYIRVRETLPDPSMTAAIVDGISNAYPLSYTVKAFDDDNNASEYSPIAEVARWYGTGLDMSVHDGTLDEFVHKIWEWGHPRDESSAELPKVRDYDQVHFGHPLIFRAAGFAIDFTDEPSGGVCPGLVVYRQGETALEWERLTPEPLYGEYGDPNATDRCTIQYFFDTGVSELEHVYAVTQIDAAGTETTPLLVSYEYAYAEDPSIVMGQYAYGAQLVSNGDPDPEDGDIFVAPNGAWELGDLPPLAPVYVTWSPSPHPDVVGYRIWVKDAFRAPSWWKLLATIDGRETVGYFDTEAPFNWPGVPPEDGSPGWQESQCRVHGAPADYNYNTPCVLTGGASYFAFYHVQAITDPNSPASPPSVQPDGGTGHTVWGDAVRAVRVGAGECPEALTFCDSCEPEGCKADAPWCPSTGCTGTDCCTWPATWPAEELFRVNFIADVYDDMDSPGYSNATQSTLYPTLGGVMEDRLLGWQSTAGLTGVECNPILCTTPDELIEGDEELRHVTAVCYPNANPDTRTFRMYTGPGDFYVEVEHGEAYGYERTTLSVNGQPYYDEFYGSAAEEWLLTADAEGYINVTIGGDEPYPGAGTESCVYAVRIQAIGETPGQLALLDLLLREHDEGGYFLAEDGGRDVSNRDVQLVAANSPPAVLGTLEIVASSGLGAASREAGSLAQQTAAPDRLIGQVTPGSEIQWLHADHLGSTRVVTDENGAVVSHHKYLPFGQEFTDVTAQQNNTHKFTGHERDSETGLDYMMARYYSPETAFRFLSVDSSQQSVRPFQPESWNRYTYVRNSPLSRFDPDGEVDIYIGGLRDNRGAPGPVKNYALDPGKGGSKALYFGHGQVKQAIAAANEFVGTEPINIIGHSYGADSAVAVAAGVEGEVDNLIGIDPVGKPLKKLVGKVGARPENVKNVVTVQGKSSSINCSDVVEALGQAVGGEPKAFKKQADTATTVEGAHHDEFDKMMNTRGEDGRSAQDILDQSYRKEDD